MAKSKSKSVKAVEAVEEVIEEAVKKGDDVKKGLQDIISSLGKQAANYQQQSKVSAAKQLRNAVACIRRVIEELEK